MDSAAVNKKRPFSGQAGGRGHQKRKKFKAQEKNKGGSDEVLLCDIRALLEKREGRSSDSIANEENGNSHKKELPELYSEIDLEIAEISSTGDGLALQKGSDQIYVVPFTVPGDKVRAKPYRHVKEPSYTLTDLVRVTTPSTIRDDDLIKCKYFGTCSGCQLQMLPYRAQLEHKKGIVEKAYRNFSSLSSDVIPKVEDTIGSPLQYGYRTKLTPHFDRPQGKRSDGRKGVQRSFDEVPPIGFNKKGGRHVLDIEDCPIGTDAVRLGMKRERRRVAQEIDTFKRGATLLLRESTRRFPVGGSDDLEAKDATQDVITEKTESHVFVKSCITNANSTSTEYVDDFVFENSAGSFFQNNNSILPVFTQYIRDHILPPSDSPWAGKIKHMIDAYCGSGLFTITLSSMFDRSLGIDISPASITAAKENASLNKLPQEHATFMAADAAELFKDVKYPADETVVVIDPPRKGCDDNFLRQLLQFSPARVVYVSCNVHTQARDVGVLVAGMKGVNGGFGPGAGVYDIESLRGFDFFPQTGHVEGVAVLKKKTI